MGWVYPVGLDRTDPAYGKAVPCRCKKLTFEKQRYLAMMKYCGLPDNADALTFDKFGVKENVKEAYESALNLIKGDIIFLTIWGKVNNGKTHLAVAVCHEYINAGIPAKYLFVPNFLDELRASYNKDADFSYQTLFNRYSEVPLLVLDDIYRQKPSPWGSEKLMGLINARYMARRSTIFTTNKTFDEIKKIDPDQGEAIISRLQRESWCKVCVIGG